MRRLRDASSHCFSIGTIMRQDNSLESSTTDFRELSVQRLAAALLGCCLSLEPTDARAVDGCQVLLCLASGNWRGITQCVPPVQQALRDLARGKALPRCSMGGQANSAEHHWSSPPAFCPPQYTRFEDAGHGSPRFICDYDGAVTVMVDGVLWSRTWWSLHMDPVTDFSDVAKAKLGTWNGRFDADYAAWVAAQNQLAVCQDC